MRLSLVVSDFHWEPGHATAAQLESLPRLPALSELLRRGRREPYSNDWRSAVASELNASDLWGSTPASVAARVLPESRIENGHWLAVPVHRVAGMSRVQLHPAGMLAMGPEEAAAFCESFAREFGGEGLRLHAVGDGLLLEGLESGAGDDVDPSACLGSELSAEPATTPAGRRRRRFHAEAEMWLHGHALNEARESRGQLAMNGLWLWGGARPLQRPSRQPAHSRGPMAFGADPFLLGIARHAGLAPPRPAQPLPALDVADALVVVSAAARDPRASALQRLETDWFAPVLQAVESGNIPWLRLRLGDRAWQVSCSRWRSVLRRASPWWEPLS
jgi:hypothetical protein